MLLGGRRLRSGGPGSRERPGAGGRAPGGLCAGRSRVEDAIASYATVGRAARDWATGGESVATTGVGSRCDSLADTHGTAPTEKGCEHGAKTIVRRPPTLLNRELSWLDFNERVLALAADEPMPLLERVKFCSIFASNLDEFFMVRVAGLMDQAASGLPVRSHDGLTPREALAAIRERVVRLMSEHSRLWKKALVPALAAEGIRDRPRRRLPRATSWPSSTGVYEREIFPVLTPLGVGPGQPFPYISGLSLSLGVLARDPDTGEERFARVKVPEQLPRFVAVGGRAGCCCRSRT